MPFTLSPDTVYLNHAAVSPWPQETAEAVTRFAIENQHVGATRYLQWMSTESELRELAAWLINAESPDSIALLKSTSEALSVVAHGLSWQSGDNIVSFDNEFPSNRIPWESLASKGVEVRYAGASDNLTVEESLFQQCDENTRLITVSSVQYSDGFRCDLEEIGTFCRERGILFCIDAIQSLGAIPFDARKYYADFVMADGHKWMMGPEGIALFYCRPELLDSLTLYQYGWHMVEDRGHYRRKSWEPASNATRFECGSPNMLGIHALHASLTQIKTLGVDQIWHRILENTQLIIDAVQKRPRLKLLSDTELARRSGIVTFAPQDHPPEKLHQHLMQQQVICAPRGGGVRFSPHYYNSTDDIAHAFRVIDQFLQ